MVEESSRTHQALAPLKVNIDLCLKKRTLESFLPYLPRGVAQRKVCTHLCWEKLIISAVPLDSITKVLNMGQLNCIQEVQVTWIWHLSILATFTPLLGQTSNVQGCHLSHIHGLPVRSSSRKLSDFPLSF